MNNITIISKNVCKLIRSSTQKDSFLRRNTLTKYEKKKIKELYKQHKMLSGHVKKK